MWKRLLLIPAVCLGLLAAVSGCSHYRAATTLRSNNLRVYDGPAKGISEVIFLGCLAGDLEIAEVDGSPLQEIRTSYGYQGEYSYLELLPGTHSVRVVGSTFDSQQKRFHTDLTVDIASFTHATTGESTLKFSAEAGHVYLIDAKTEKQEKRADTTTSGYIIRIFIKDVQTKQIIVEDRRAIVK